MPHYLNKKKEVHRAFQIKESVSKDNGYSKKDTLEGTRLMLCFHVDLSCINKSRNLDTIVCECNHLSMFGVLVVSMSLMCAHIASLVLLLIYVTEAILHYKQNMEPVECETGYTPNADRTGCECKFSDIV